MKTLPGWQPSVPIGETLRGANSGNDSRKRTWLANNRPGGLTGRLLGSSQRAHAERVRTAPLLEIPLAEGQLSDEAARAIAEEPDDSHPTWIERKVWLAMYDTFRHSAAHQCAVVYS